MTEEGGWQTGGARAVGCSEVGSVLQCNVADAGTQSPNAHSTEAVTKTWSIHKCPRGSTNKAGWRRHQELHDLLLLRTPATSPASMPKHLLLLSRTLFTLNSYLGMSSVTRSSSTAVMMRQNMSTMPSPSTSTPTRSWKKRGHVTGNSN